MVEPYEYSEVINARSTPLNVLNWSVRDDDGNVFHFPSHIMQPDQACRVYTDEFHPEHCGFSFGNDRAIWGNSGDIVILKDPIGTTVDEYCWGSGCP